MSNTWVSISSGVSLPLGEGTVQSFMPPIFSGAPPSSAWMCADSTQITASQRFSPACKDHHPVAEPIQIHFNISNLSHSDVTSDSVKSAAVKSEGAKVSPPGRPKEKSTPSGGSAVREATSEGAIFLKRPIFIGVWGTALRH